MCEIDLDVLAKRTAQQFVHPRYEPVDVGDSRLQHQFSRKSQQTLGQVRAALRRTAYELGDRLQLRIVGKRLAAAYRRQEGVGKGASTNGAEATPVETK